MHNSVSSRSHVEGKRNTHVVYPWLLFWALSHGELFYNRVSPPIALRLPAQFLSFL